MDGRRETSTTAKRMKGLGEMATLTKKGKTTEDREGLSEVGATTQTTGNSRADSEGTEGTTSATMRDEITNQATIQTGSEGQREDALSSPRRSQSKSKITEFDTDGL